MAVYTHISKEELEGHLARYGLGALVSFAGIGEGVENTNYRLETAKGKFILTLFEGRVRAEDLPFCLGFMEFLNARGVPCPAVVKDGAGETITPLKGKLSAVTTFLEGRNLKAATVPQCAAMGETLARMHLAGRDFPATRQNTMARPEWRRLIEACGDRADAVEPGLTAFLHEELRFHETPPRDLPRGAVHADAFPDNVFFTGDRLSGVIDFYFACTDAFAYDLMLTLNAWCGADAEKARGFLAGYRAARALSAEERASLPAMGRAAALRITATRLYDLLHPKPGAVVSPKDPLEHARLIRFHRAAKPEDYGA